MNEEQFYEFAADQYKEELSAAPDRLFRQLRFVTLGIVIAAGFLGYVTQSEYLSERGIVVSLYYTSAVLAAVLLALSAGFGLAVLRPKTYIRVKPASFWSEWKKSYTDDLVTNHGYSEVDAMAIAQSAIRPAVLRQMMGFTIANRNVNERRFWLLNTAIGLMTMAFVAIGIEAVCLGIVVL